MSNNLQVREMNPQTLDRYRCYSFDPGNTYDFKNSIA